MTCDVLLLCVNDNEFKGILIALESLSITTKMFKVDKLTYHDCGIINGASVLCLQTGMGSISLGASGPSLTQAIQEVNPKYVIAVGVAYGADKSKTGIGTILISDDIQLIEPEKITVENGQDKYIPRGNNVKVPRGIFGMFKASQHYHSQFTFEIGKLLTGEKLINNPKFKTKLLEEFPEAIGGEMEAAGIYAATSYSSDLEWIVIKAVCDFADGKKDENKQANQELAASNAAKFVINTINKLDFKSQKKNSTFKNDLSPNLKFDSSCPKLVLSSNSFADYIPQDPIHSEAVLKELEIIKKRRVFLEADKRNEIQLLINRVQEGDLRFCSQEVLGELYYWSCYLLLSDEELDYNCTEYFNFLRKFKIDDKRVKIIESLIGNKITTNLSKIEHPDARTILLANIIRREGDSKALEWYLMHPLQSNLSMFNGVGWRQILVLYMKNNKWDEALKLANQFTKKIIDECPHILYLQAILNIGYLISHNGRPELLKILVISKKMDIEDVDKAYKAKALLLLDKAKLEFIELKLQQFSELCDYWRLNLNFAFQDDEGQSIEDLQNLINTSENRLLFFNLVSYFNIKVNFDTLKNYLKRKQIERSLTKTDLAVKFFMFQNEEEDLQLIQFSSEYRSDLLEVIPLLALFNSRMLSFIRSGSYAEAIHELDVHKGQIEDYEIKRWQLKIKSLNNENVELFELEELYEKTRDNLDLYNLCNYLEDNKQWNALLPKIEKLFNLSPSSRNLLKYVKSLSFINSSQDKILHILNENDRFLNTNTNEGAYLLFYKARCYFHLGKLTECEDFLSKCKGYITNSDYLNLELNLILRNGAWEKIASVIEHEFMKAASLPSELILKMAILSQIWAKDRAMSLLEIAVNKDSKLSSTAYFLASQMGVEDVAQEWLGKLLSEVSEKKDDSVITYTLPELKDLIEKDNTTQQIYEKKYLAGELPHHLLPIVMNVPISHILIGNGQWNFSKEKVQQKTIIPVWSGFHKPNCDSEIMSIGLDVTSLFLLEYFGVFENFINQVSEIFISPRVMEILWEERIKVQFHQPSKIKEAIDIIKFEELGSLRVIKEGNLDVELKEEVGNELSSLILSAKENGGRVVACLPISKVGTLGDENAVLSEEYNSFIISPIQLIDLIEDELEETIAVNAKTFFNKISKNSLNDCTLEGISQECIYIDNLALHYLYYTKTLKGVLSFFKNIYIAESTILNFKGLKNRGDYGNTLVDFLDNLRIKIRDNLSKGKIKYFGQFEINNEKIKDKSIYMDSLHDIFLNTHLVDAVCCDDRYINKNGFLNNKSGSNTPILNFQDILEVCDISEQCYKSVKKKMRDSCYAFTRITSKEVLELILKRVNNANSKFTENTYLKSLRQSILFVRQSIISSELDMQIALLNLPQVGIEVMKEIWQTKNLSIPLSNSISEWLLRTFLFFPSEVVNVHNEVKKKDLENQDSVLLTKFVFLGLMLHGEKKKKYGEFLIENVLSKFNKCNNGAIDLAFENFGTYLRQIQYEQI